MPEPPTEKTQETETEQIASWYRDDARRYCTQPWKSAVIMSDGTVVCACSDMTVRNPLGNIYDHSFKEIWSAAPYTDLRNSIATDIDKTEVCRGCPYRIENPAPPLQADGQATPPVTLPRVLHIESTVSCNLNCSYMCQREPIEDSRSNKVLDYEVYTKLIDELSPGLIYMSFHVGGENWIHPKAVEMVNYCRLKNPHVFIISSTNGHFFRTEEKLRRALLSGTDCFIFSIDGTRQESYEKYRTGGDFQTCFDAMKNMVALRNQLGRRRPVIVWRYILFEWNSSEAEMNQARQMAKDIGVDFLSWHLNAGPQEISSKRYHIGSPHLHEIKDELWDLHQTHLEHYDLRFGSYD